MDDDTLYQKLINKERLTEKELCYFFDSFGIHVEETNGDNRRWSRTVTMVKKFNDRYFMCSYEEGLTECQDSMFDEQPYEVQQHCYEKKIIVTEWKMVK